MASLKSDNVDEDTRKFTRTDNCDVCTGRKVMVGSAVVLLLLAGAMSTCMVVVFAHNNQLLSRMEQMEAKVAACDCQAHRTENSVRDTLRSLYDQILPDQSSRKKRQILPPSPSQHQPVSSTEKPELHEKLETPSALELLEGLLNEEDYMETAHIRHEHHGIASSNIALLYADPEVLYRAANDSDQSSLLAFHASRWEMPECSQSLESGEGTIWCVPHSRGRQSHKIMLNGRSSSYSYFAQAPWMDAEMAKENFGVTADERMVLVVKKAGLYIVTSSIHLEDVTTTGVHYGVYVRDRLNSIDSEKVLGVCASSVNPRDEDGIMYPCNTWQLTPLRAGDRVFLKINPFVWLRVEKESFFLAAIKLNDWEL